MIYLISVRGKRGAGKPIKVPRGGEGDPSLMRFWIWKCMCEREGGVCLVGMG